MINNHYILITIKKILLEYYPTDKVVQLITCEGKNLSDCFEIKHGRKFEKTIQLLNKTAGNNLTNLIECYKSIRI